MASIMTTVIHPQVLAGICTAVIVARCGGRMAKRPSALSPCKTLLRFRSPANLGYTNGTYRSRIASANGAFFPW